MSVYNYNNFNIAFDEHHNTAVNQDNIDPKSEDLSVKERLQRQQEQLDLQVNNNLSTIREHAYSSIDFKPVQDAKRYAQEIKEQSVELAGSGYGKRALDEFQEYMRNDGAFAKRYIAGVDDATTLWQQRIGTPKRSQFLNPALVEQHRQSIESGEAVDSFMPGEQNSRQVQMDLKVMTPEMAAAYERIRLFQGNIVAARRLKRFHSRPGVETYKKLFASGGNFKGVYFQFQNDEVINELLSTKTSFDLVTQQLDTKAMEDKENTRVNILAANELILGLTGQSSHTPENQNAYGVQSDGSFHIKIGFIAREGVQDGDLQYESAFISSQNITSALERKQTVESLLVFNRDTSFETEKEAGYEVSRFTEYTIDKAKEARKEGRQFLASDMNDAKQDARLENRQYLYIQDEVKDRYYDLINTAAVKGGDDKVVIAMSEFTSQAFMDIDDKGKSETRENLLKLAESDRLVVAIDKKSVQKAYEKKDTDPTWQLYSDLADKGALQIVATSKMHEKSISIFDNATGQLKAYSLGSANLTRSALDGTNTEAITVFGSGVYQDEGRTAALTPEARTQQSADTQAYLDSIQQGDNDVFMQHVQLFTSGKWGLGQADRGMRDDPRVFTKGYKAEMPSNLYHKEIDRIRKIENLAEDIKRYNSSTLSGKGYVDVEMRFNPEARNATLYDNVAGQIPDAMAPTGLRVTVKSPEGEHSLSLDLTVNEEGTVTLMDNSKALTAALQKNASEGTQVLFEQATGQTDETRVRRKVLKAGESVKLNSFETTLGLINTIQRQFVYQSEYMLPDTHFQLAANINRDKTVASSGDILAEGFRTLLPDYAKSKGTDGRPVDTNLATMLYQLSQQGEDVRRESVRQLGEHISNRRYGPDSVAEDLFPTHRAYKLSPLLDSLDKALSQPLTEMQAVEMAKEVSMDFTRVLYADSQQEFDQKLLVDIRREIIKRDPKAYQEYKAAARTQASVLKDDLTAPFLAAHEANYSGFQGVSRLPVYGETTNFKENYKDTPLATLMSQGILNPLEMGHATTLGRGGQYWRALGATSYGAMLELPAVGGLRQLTVQDTDLSTGAAVVTDMDVFNKSVSNLATITYEDFKQELDRLKEVFNIKDLDDETAMNIFRRREETEEGSGETMALMYSSFSKAERLTQRIKNVTGGKPAVDISAEYVQYKFGEMGITDAALYEQYGLTAPTPEKLAELQTKQEEGKLDVIGGRLRSALSPAQMERVREVRIAIAKEKGYDSYRDVPFELVQRYFRRAQANKSNNEAGFIGGSEMRRVALGTGVNMLSDPNYLNAGYQVGADAVTGTVTRAREKMNVDNLESVTDQIELGRILSRDGMATTTPIQQDGVVYKPGYYIKNDEGKPELVATYTDDGYLQFKDVYETRKDRFGEGKRAKNFKLKAFTQRTENATTFISGVPNLIEGVRGLNTLEVDTVTIKRPSSGNRPGAGDGLGKGPFEAMTANWFSNKLDKVAMEEIFTRKEQETFERLMNIDNRIQERRPRKTFALMNINNLKGFPSRAGISMVASDIIDSEDADIRRQSSFITLYEQKGLDVAKSLSLLFLGDKNIRAALAKHYENDPLRQMAIMKKGDKIDITTKGMYKGAKGTDINNMVLMASGLLGLSGDASDLQLEGLKKKVLAALEGKDLNAAKDLEKRAQQLLMKARSSGEEYGNLIKHEGKEFAEKVQLNDHDGMVTAAGIYASMTLYKSQLLGDKDLATARLAPDATKFTMNVMPTDIVSTYYGDRELYRDDAGKVQVREVKSESGLTPESYKQVIDFAHTLMGVKLKNIDHLFQEQDRMLLKEGKEEEAYQIYQQTQFLMQSFESMIGRGPVLMTLMDIDMSQSLVPSGMSDSVKQEFSNYVNLSGDRLSMFREVVGLEDNVQAKNVQHAYFMMLSLLDRNLFSITQGEADRRASFKLPFLGEDLAGGKTYNIFTSPTSMDLQTAASLYTKNPGVDNAVRKVVREIVDLEKQRDPNTGNLKSDSFYNITEFVDELVKNDFQIDRSRQGPMYDADGNPLHLSGVEALLAARQRSVTDPYRDYIAGLQAVEKGLLAEARAARGRDDNAAVERLIALRNEVHGSKNVVIPELELDPIMDDSTGKFRVRVRPVTPGNTPSLAVQLGTDILANTASVFGDHETDVIKKQISYIETLYENQSTFGKLARGGGEAYLTQKEIDRYIALQDAARKTYQSIMTPLTSDVGRQAFGDHETFKGAVGIPVNTHLLNPWEMVVGDRFLRLAGDGQGETPVGQLMNRLLDRFNKGKDVTGMLLQFATTYATKVNAAEQSVVQFNAAQVESVLNIEASGDTYQRKLQHAYTAALRKAGIDTDNFPVDLQRTDGELNDFNKKIIQKAKLYSEMTDWSEDEVIRMLVEDEIDLKRVTQEGVPNRWDDFKDGNYKNQQKQYRIDRMILANLGTMSERTGAPGSASSPTTEQEDYKLMTVSQEAERQRIIASEAREATREYYEGPLFTSDEELSDNLMKVPSISRFLSMLGDYDGDSHRIIINRSQSLLLEINSRYAELDQIDKAVDAIEEFKALGIVDDPGIRERKRNHRMVNEVLKHLGFYRTEEAREEVKRSQRQIDKQAQVIDQLKPQVDEAIQEKQRQKFAEKQRILLGLEQELQVRREAVESIVLQRQLVQEDIDALRKQINRLDPGDVYERRHLNRQLQDLITDIQGIDEDLRIRNKHIKAQERYLRGVERDAEGTYTASIDDLIGTSLKNTYESEVRKLNNLKGKSQAVRRGMRSYATEVIQTMLYQSPQIAETDYSEFLKQVKAQPELMRDYIADIKRDPELGQELISRLIGGLDSEIPEQRVIRNIDGEDQIITKPASRSELPDNLISFINSLSDQIDKPIISDDTVANFETWKDQYKGPRGADLESIPLFPLDTRGIDIDNTTEYIDRLAKLNRYQDISKVTQERIVNNLDVDPETQQRTSEILGTYETLRQAGQALFSEELRGLPTYNPLPTESLDMLRLSVPRLQEVRIENVTTTFLGSSSVSRFDTYFNELAATGAEVYNLTVLPQNDQYITTMTSSQSHPVDIPDVDSPLQSPQYIPFDDSTPPRLTSSPLEATLPLPDPWLDTSTPADYEVLEDYWEDDNIQLYQQEDPWNVQEISDIKGRTNEETAFLQRQESYKRQIEVIRQVQAIQEGASPLDMLDYVTRMQKFTVNVLDVGSDTLGQQELNMQIALFEHQQKMAADISAKINTIDSEFDRKILQQALEVERNRLRDSQKAIVKNIESYLGEQIPKSPEGDGSDVILNRWQDNFKQDIEDITVLLLAQEERIREELEGSDTQEGLQQVLNKLETASRTLAARSVEDVRRFISNYTGLPSFMTEARPGQEALGLGTMTALMSQRFSQDGIKAHAEEAKERIARTGLFSAAFETADNQLLGFEPYLFNREFVDKLANLGRDQSLIEEERAFARQLLASMEKRSKDAEPNDKYGITPQSIDKAKFSQIDLSRPTQEDGILKQLQAIGQVMRTKGLDETSTQEEIQTSIMEAYGVIYNQSTAFDDLSSQIKKAQGETLDPFEYDAAIRLIGEGGSKLIGDAYNTLIPLLDQTLIETPFTAHTDAKSEMFREYISGLERKLNKDMNDTDTRAVQAEVDAAYSMAQKLGVDVGPSGLTQHEEAQMVAQGIITEDADAKTERLAVLEENRKLIEDKFYNTIGVVSSFQQIARDALKPPVDSGVMMSELFSQNRFKLPVTKGSKETYVGASLKDILTWEDSDYSQFEQQEIKRKGLRKFLGKVIGTTLGAKSPEHASRTDMRARRIDPKLSQASRDYLQSIEGQKWASNITGFGALMMLSDFSKTEEGKFYSTFIQDDDSLYGYTRQDFEDWMNLKEIKDTVGVEKENLAREYVKTRIVDLMQRTQAGFAVESVISSAKSNPSMLMNRLSKLYDASKDSAEFEGYHNIMKQYQSVREGLNNLKSKDKRDDNISKLDRETLFDIVYEKHKLEQSRTGAFNPEAIEYLRTVQQDLSKIDQSGNVDPTTTQKMSALAINNVINRLRRGKIKDKLEAMTMGQFQLQTLSDTLQKGEFSQEDIKELLLGKDITDGNARATEQIAAAAMIQGLIKQTNLDDKEKVMLAKMLASNDKKGVMRLEKLAAESAALIQYRNIAREAATSAVGGDTARDSFNVVNQVLNSFFDSQAEFASIGPDQPIPTTRVMELMLSDKFRQMDIEQQQKYLFDTINAANQPAMTSVDIAQTRIKQNYAAEGLGIFASPFIFALGAGELDIDERIQAFSIDALQGLAEISTQRGTASQEFLGNFKQAASTFSRSRMRMSLYSEGMGAGLVQGLGQEMMYKGISDLTSDIIQNTIGRPMIQRQVGIGAIGTTIGAEIVGSVLGQGLSKALFQVRATPTSTPVGSPITNMLSHYIDQIWQAAEDAQLQMVNAEYEVLDTDHNTNMDFEITAIPSSTWYDIESGILIVDDSGSAVETEFENQDVGHMQTANAGRTGGQHLETR